MPLKAPIFGEIGYERVIENFQRKAFHPLWSSFLLIFEKFYISDSSRMKRVYNQSVSINERSLPKTIPKYRFLVGSICEDSVVGSVHFLVDVFSGNWVM